MSSHDFLEEQRRRQRELIEAKRARQNPETVGPELSNVSEPTTLSRKIKDFWFYHKFKVLTAVFLAAVLCIGISQCARREKFDTEVVLYSYYTYSSSQLDALEAQLELYGEDLNGDGEVNIQIVDCSYSEAELYEQQNAKSTKLTAVLASNDDALLFITDKESFERLNTQFENTEFFVDLALPENGGKSLVLPQSFCDGVNGQTPGFVLPSGLRISRRIADETTLIGQSADIEEKISAAEKTLERLSAE